MDLGKKFLEAELFDQGHIHLLSDSTKLPSLLYYVILHFPANGVKEFLLFLTFVIPNIFPNSLVFANLLNEKQLHS